MPPPPCAIVVYAAVWEDVGRIGIYNVGAPGGAERADRPARPGIARRTLHTPHAAQPQRALLYEKAPLFREAVAQQDVSAGSPAPGAACLSARQEVK